MTRSPRARTDAEYGAFFRRITKAFAERVASGDPELLGALVAMRDELDAAIALSVEGLKLSGATWEEIGAATGTSRQAAWEKWGKRRTLADSRS